METGAERTILRYAQSPLRKEMYRTAQDERATDSTGQGEAKVQEERLTLGARPALSSCMRALIGLSSIPTPVHANVRASDSG